MCKKIEQDEKTLNFIKACEELHGGKYNYSEVEYVNNKTKIKIFCNKHAEYFYQTANNHKNGQRCKKCGDESRTFIKRDDTESFIKKAKKINGDKFNYSEVEYVNNHTKIKIYCNNHKKFFIQTPNNHLSRNRNSGCDICGKESRTLKTTSTTTDFIKKSKILHGDKYIYDCVQYLNNQTKVKIYCKKHKTYFLQRPVHHLIGAGCQYCQNSKGESLIKKYCDDNNIQHIQQAKFEKCVGKNPLAFDFFIPHLNLLVEFQGEQHYNLIKKWGGEEGLKKRQSYDNIKRIFAKINNYTLLEIPYTLTRREIVFLLDLYILEKFNG